VASGANVAAPAHRQANGYAADLDAPGDRRQVEAHGLGAAHGDADDDADDQDQQPERQGGFDAVAALQVSSVRIAEGASGSVPGTAITRHVSEPWHQRAGLVPHAPLGGGRCVTPAWMTLPSHLSLPVFANTGARS